MPVELRIQLRAEQDRPRGIVQPEQQDDPRRPACRTSSCTSSRTTYRARTNRSGRATSGRLLRRRPRPSASAARRCSARGSRSTRTGAALRRTRSASERMFQTQVKPPLCVRREIASPSVPPSTIKSSIPAVTSAETSTRKIEISFTFQNGPRLHPVVGAVDRLDDRAHRSRRGPDGQSRPKTSASTDPDPPESRLNESISWMTACGATGSRKLLQRAVGVDQIQQTDQRDHRREEREQRAVRHLLREPHAVVRDELPSGSLRDGEPLARTRARPCSQCRSRPRRAK